MKQPTEANYANRALIGPEWSEPSMDDIIEQQKKI